MDFFVMYILFEIEYLKLIIVNNSVVNLDKIIISHEEITTPGKPMIKSSRSIRGMGKYQQPLTMLNKKIYIIIMYIMGIIIYYGNNIVTTAVMTPATSTFEVTTCNDSF